MPSAGGGQDAEGQMVSLAAKEARQKLDVGGPGRWVEISCVFTTGNLGDLACIYRKPRPPHHSR